MKKKFNTTERLALFDGSNNEVVSREIPSSFPLLKYGKNSFTVGGKQSEFDFTEADADIVLQEFNSRGKDLVIDYEHQSLSGDQAPAAGWISGLEKTAEGVVAIVKYWTEKAKQYLANGEYRYFSPVVQFSRTMKTPRILHSVALTNHPALHNIPALVADDLAGENDSIEIEEEEHENKEVKLMDALKKIAEALGVAVSEDSEASVKAILDGISGMKEKEKGMVAMSDLEKAKKELAKAKAEHAVAKAKMQNKLTVELEPWAMTLAEKDIQAFSDWCEKAPVVGGAKSTPPPPVIADVSAPVAFTDSQATQAGEKWAEYCKKTMGINLSEEQIKTLCK